MQTPLLFFLALVFVLALIGLVAYLVRRFGPARLGNSGGRGRAPRLAVIDQAAVDGRRRLVLVRRDNVEHLLMIGGPSDIVVEPNIIRAAAAGRDLPRANEITPRAADSSAWLDTDTDAGEAPSEAPARASRPSFDAEVRKAAPSIAAAPQAPDRRIEPLANSVPEPALRAEPPRQEAARHEPVRHEPPRQDAPRQEAVRVEPARAEVRPDPRLDIRPELARANLRAEPSMTRPLARALDSTRGHTPARAGDAPRVEAPPSFAPAVTTGPAPGLSQAEADQNLADMAKRLEAALRRPQGDPASTSTEAPIVRPTLRNDPVTSSAPPVAAPSIKTGFENLEDEMASLLGRPKTPS